jgi:hypothetical protein
MIARWLRVDEAADLLRRHRSSLYGDIRVGEVPALKIHHRLTRVPATALPQLADLVNREALPAAITLRWLAEEWRCSQRHLVRLAQRGVLPVRQRTADTVPTWACTANEYRAWVAAHSTGSRS